MLLLLAAYFGGMLTIVSPCVLPMLPFVFARAGLPFRQHLLPMLLGMVVAFVLVSTLAAIGGAWLADLNQFGRVTALLLFFFFGLALVFPSLAVHIARPMVVLGERLGSSPAPVMRGSVVASIAVGIGSGLLWAPCAGPILGLVLTAVIVRGAHTQTVLLLLAYAAGAATALACALVVGGQLLSMLRGVAMHGESLRRVAGTAVLFAVVAIAAGWDTGLLSRLSIGTTTVLEQQVLDRLTDKASVEPLVSASSLPTSGAKPTLPVLAEFPTFDGALEWINSGPLTTNELRGKVVLVDFWTYSCINCLRTLPYVRTWAAKYADAGLVVIGVHAPEFAFEKRSANVHRAVKDLRIVFPVVVDSDFKIWRAFANQYWPAFYLIDAQGRIRHRQFGEGGYEESELAIQRLLAEVGRLPETAGLATPEASGVEVAPDLRGARSPETYLGYAHDLEGFAKRSEVARDQAHRYGGVSILPVNQWALDGEWTVGPEFAESTKPRSRIAYRFDARDLHLVLGPVVEGRAVRFKVTIDGKPPLDEHGSDINAEGNGVVDVQRLYQLVRERGPSHDHRFEIEFLDEGVQAYVFTFG